MGKFKEISLEELKKYSIKDRPSKVHLDDLAKIEDLSELNFPDILAAKDLKELVDRCADAIKAGKPIFVALGGHVIKCGLAPFLIEMIKKGWIKGLSSNGSVIIHDFELAMFGKTSEDVATALEDGSFGMVTETCDSLNKTIQNAAENKLGYGEAVGKYLVENKAPNNEISLVAKAYEYDVPFTVHVALGTDINHQHETADGAAIGDCSMRDFRILCNNLIQLNEGGVFLNFGSAVILPEVFLKAITVVRNLGYPLKNFYTAVFDMNMHYRPRTNIVHRPTLSGGKGYYFVGHHEIMIPLFYKLLKDKIDNA
ncbi:MAG: hypothetical protein K9N09_09940 [Candidatus Cloacimonetes bacterium]|nr:hypothetical protein [Candidatus Cloacimonadota bacterium]MCF7814426.1 hypothetical protein [Candidatus Cloacimonadota bacterium]MCF7869012.1 hypothetical protein [Candidatus Cloacimonadota bacterium]MCF7884410.1 hypothetical protein [Candidatus Cloacimonadota bacterium]